MVAKRHNGLGEGLYDPAGSVGGGIRVTFTIQEIQAHWKFRQSQHLIHIQSSNSQFVPCVLCDHDLILVISSSAGAIRVVGIVAMIHVHPL